MRLVWVSLCREDRFSRDEAHIIIWCKFNIKVASVVMFNRKMMLLSCSTLKWRLLSSWTNRCVKTAKSSRWGRVKSNSAAFHTMLISRPAYVSFILTQDFIVGRVVWREFDVILVKTSILVSQPELCRCTQLFGQPHGPNSRSWASNQLLKLIGNLKPTDSFQLTLMTYLQFIGLHTHISQTTQQQFWLHLWHVYVHTIINMVQ